MPSSKRGSTIRCRNAATVRLARSCRPLLSSTRLRNRRNGGRDAAGLVEHLRHDAEVNGFIPWAWNPGGGRETPPGTFEDHVKDVAMWGAAGQPCPD